MKTETLHPNMDSVACWTIRRILSAMGPLRTSAIAYELYGTAGTYEGMAHKHLMHMLHRGEVKRHVVRVGSVNLEMWSLVR